MDEDAEKQRKMRIRMDRDVYSVLVSFKDGATARKLERRMDDTLGYTYNYKYHEGGVHDMEELLMQHDKVRHVGNGIFKVIPTAEVTDLLKLISKQYDGPRDQRNKRRSATITPRGGRRFTEFGSWNYRGADPDAGFGGVQPLMSIPTSLNLPHPSAFSTPEPITSNDILPTVQRPLRRPGVSSATFSAPSKCAEDVPTKPPSRMPSIKEFQENSKQMMDSQWPVPVHLSELTDLYAKHFGVVVDPLQLYSKSWKMLVTTTFSSWLEMNEDGGVKMKKTEPNPAPPPTPKTPKASGPFSFRIPLDLQKANESFRKEQLKSAEKALPTPEKPPGVTMRTDPEPHKDFHRPKSSCALLFPKTVVPPRRATPTPILQGQWVYDFDLLWSLKTAERSEEMKKRIGEALDAMPALHRNRGTLYPKLSPTTRAGRRATNTFKNTTPFVLPLNPDRDQKHKKAPSTAPNSRPSSNPPPETRITPKLTGLKFGQRKRSPATLTLITPSIRNQTPEAQHPGYAPLKSPSAHSTARRPLKLPPMCKGKVSKQCPPPSRPVSSRSRASFRSRIADDVFLTDGSDSEAEMSW